MRLEKWGSFTVSRFSKQIDSLSLFLKKNIKIKIQKISKTYIENKFIKYNNSLLHQILFIKKKLNYIEEYSIDKYNLNRLNFKEKELYFRMLKEILPKNHSRLKLIKKELLLYEYREKNFNNKKFELVFLLDMIFEIYEKIPNNQKKEITEQTLIDIYQITNNILTYLHKLDKKSEMYYFINEFYGININEQEEQLLEVLKYIKFKIKIRQTLINYAKTSLTTGEL